MGLIEAKEKVKEIVSADLIDVQGEINSKGNYIHLSGTTRVSTLKTAFIFSLTIVGHSLTGSEDSIENILSEVLKNIFLYELEEQADLNVSSKIVKIEDLLAYEIKLTIEDKTR